MLQKKKKRKQRQFIKNKTVHHSWTQTLMLLVSRKDFLSPTQVLKGLRTHTHIHTYAALNPPTISN